MLQHEAHLGYLKKSILISSFYIINLLCLRGNVPKRKAFCAISGLYGE